MLDNKGSDRSDLKFAPLQIKYQIYDRNCLNCPSSVIHVSKSKGERILMKGLSEAIDFCIYSADYRPIRSCSEEPGFSLDEIIINGCVLWGKGEIESEDENELFKEDKIIPNLKEIIYG